MNISGSDVLLGIAVITASSGAYTYFYSYVKKRVSAEEILTEIREDHLIIQQRLREIEDLICHPDKCDL